MVRTMNDAPRRAVWLEAIAHLGRIDSALSAIASRAEARAGDTWTPLQQSLQTVAGEVRQAANQVASVRAMIESRDLFTDTTEPNR